MCVHNCVLVSFSWCSVSLLALLSCTEKAFAAEFSIVIKCCVCAHSVKQTMGYFFFFSHVLRGYKTCNSLSLTPSEKIWGSTSHEAATSLQSTGEAPRRGGCSGWRGGWGCLCRGWVVLQSLHQIMSVGHNQVLISLLLLVGSGAQHGHSINPQPGLYLRWFFSPARLPELSSPEEMQEGLSLFSVPEHLSCVWRSCLGRDVSSDWKCSVLLLWFQW